MGLFAAASRQSRFRAARNALGLLVLLVLIPFWLGRAFAASALGGVFGSLSPLTSYVMAADTLYPGHWAAYWSSLGAVQGTTWLLLVWAGIRLRRMVQAEGAPSMAPLAKPALKVRRAVGLGRWQPSRAEDTPIEWLVHREHGVSVFIWVGAVLSLSGSGWISAMLGGFGMPTRVLFLPSGWILGGTVGLVGAALVAWVASRFFVRVRRTGELELLLTTPLGMRSIVADQWKVLQRFFVWPVPLLQGVLLVPMLSMVHFPLLRGWPVSVVTSMLFGLLDSWLAVAALCWVGMWFGVKGRGQAAAILWTLAVVKGVPLVLGVSLTIASRMLMMLLFQSAFFPARWIPALLSWSVQLVVLVFYASAIGWAKHRLDLELAGVEEALFKPRLELARVVQIWAQGFHRVRHWTP